MPSGWQLLPNPVDVGVRVFTARTMTQVGTELKHRESALHHALAEDRIIFAVLLGFSRQVEENHDPHNSVFVEAHMTLKTPLNLLQFEKD